MEETFTTEIENPTIAGLGKLFGVSDNIDVETTYNPKVKVEWSFSIEARDYGIKSISAVATRLTATIEWTASTESMSEEDKAKLKGCRWVLVKNSADLTLAEQEKLNIVYDTSPELKQVHLLKEDFRRIFEEEDDMEKASKALEDWISRVMDSGLKGLEKFLSTLNKWKASILNYFNGKVTNGFEIVENTCFPLI